MQTEGKKKLIKAVMIVFIPALILTGVLLFFTGCKTETYEIFGNERYSDKEILSFIVKDRSDEYAPLLWLKSKWSEQQKIPFVEYYEVELTGPDSVKIYVYEKMLCGSVKIMGSYMCFDKDGYVCESMTYRDTDVPEVTGLSFGRVVLNEKIETGDEELFNKILDICFAIKKYKCPVNEIHFNSDQSVVLHMGKSRALLGNQKSYDAVINALSAAYEAAGDRALLFDLKTFEPGNGSIIGHPLNEG